ncbi:hypothetical protein HN954_01985 [bacterium]|jgi:hypothetical protein|nr:hypothetical protein [bacterium]MBT6831529.1 hypothetical protein [bacterium]MBT6996180.1 hypothetical protein [bacterium]MBT7772562.1 hypothetical protein [bacterium]
MPKSDPLLKILDLVLEKADRGEDLNVILDEFPEHTEEIREFLEVRQFLSSQSSAELPSKKLLKQSIDQCFLPQKSRGDWGFLFRPFFKRGLSAVLPLLILTIGGWWWWMTPTPTPVEEEIARVVEQEITQEIDSFYEEMGELEQIQETDLFAVTASSNSPKL